MLQMQFMLDDLVESEEIDHDLEFIGIDADNIHYLSKNTQDLVDHDLHVASVFEERNIVSSIIQGAIWGLLLGIFLSVLTFFLQPFDWQPQWYNFVLITILSIGFSIWLGGLAGIGYENYKISDFHQYLLNGNALLMVYIRPSDVQSVRAMMSDKHPDARYLTTREALDNPFNSGKFVEYD